MGRGLCEALLAVAGYDHEQSGVRDLYEAPFVVFVELG